MKNNIYTVSPHLSFTDTLAAWLLERHTADPLALSRLVMFLPSRRACEAQREAFLRQSGGKPLLLPRIRPLDDAADALLLPCSVAVSPDFTMRRLFILAKLIQSYRTQTTGIPERFDHSVRLAQELGQLLDEIEREQASLADLANLVPDSFAAHWQLTVEFLQVLSHHWPQIAAEASLVSPEQARNAMLEALGDHWQKNPPAYPVIAAGTTGSIPATAHLLTLIANLPHGAIVLPGLDNEADDDYFSSLSENHPQWGMQQLLKRLKCPRAEVRRIGASPSARVALWSEVMRPVESETAFGSTRVDVAASCAGLRYVPCAGLQEEAGAVALMLREMLEEEGKTAALITHDRSLARRVAAMLRRFGVIIDDSAGTPLMQMPAAAFLRLLLEVAHSDGAPLPLLSLLKHPLTHAGMERIACLEAARAIEVALLRGVQGNSGFSGLFAEVQRSDKLTAQGRELIVNVQKIFAPLNALYASRDDALHIPTIAKAHIACAEALAGETLWTGPEADALSEFIAELIASSTDNTIAPRAYPALFEALLAEKTYRPRYGMHPRLKILSPIGARLQSFDRIILGGLNEGSWPPDMTADPWFNRTMRKTLGLPAPEQRVGLAAHDFFMLANAQEVFITRALKVDGVATIPSRWLMKLGVLLSSEGGLAAIEDTSWNDWALALDKAADPTPLAPPAPKPPLAARPRELSVTQVEKLLRDPYAVYAAHVLKLRPLKPIAQEPNASDYGNALHTALEQFVKTYPQGLPQDALDALLALGKKAFAPLFFSPGVEALWWPRFMRTAQWLIEQEMAIRPRLKQVLAEVKGSYVLNHFTLTGRADRMEQTAQGGLTIVDYKTGGAPAFKEIQQGVASQLVLLALIASEGGMAVRGTIEDLQYWQLKNKEDAKQIISLGEQLNIPECINAAKEGIALLIARYGNPDVAYFCIPPAPDQPNDYALLERVKEWR